MEVTGIMNWPTTYEAVWSGTVYKFAVPTRCQGGYNYIVYQLTKTDGKDYYLRYALEGVHRGQSPYGVLTRSQGP